jgi:predicted amino acid dehydrogenase
MEETRFAFIVHPENKRHWQQILQHLNEEKPKTRSVILSQRNLDYSDPFHLTTLSFLSNGKTTICDVILCPLLPGEMVADEARAVSKIVKSVEIARMRGARLIGLGGFTSIVGNGGLDIARQVSLPVTSGNTYTASSVVKAIIMASEGMNIDLSKSCIAIIGATGDIGSSCSKSLAELFGEMILVARNDQRLEELAQFLKSKCSRVSIEKRASKAARIADVVLTVTSSTTTLIEADDLKKNSIVCDISYPANIAKEIGMLRPDILVFEGGIVTSDQFVSQLEPEGLFWDFNPIGGMHTCFVETLLLTLEDKFSTYSIGRGAITQEKMREMSDLGNKHNFRPIFSWDGRIMKNTFGHTPTSKLDHT